MREPAKRPKTRGREKRRTGLLIFGLLLVLAGSVGLFWNEWRSASLVATLIAGERGVMSLGLDRVPRDVGGRLVHVVGPARPSGVVEDPLFGIGHAALRLDRIVEMYQWREHSEGSGDNRSTRHERVWAEGRIASERFRDRVGRSNPPAPSIQSERHHPPEVTLGVYSVARTLIDLLHADEMITVPRGAGLFVHGIALEGEGAAFYSGSSTSPEIGDVRVRFRAVPPGEISVLAGLDGAVLRPWTATNGGRIAMVEAGRETADGMLGAAHRGNALRSWAARAAGALALVLGFSLLVGHAGRRFPQLGERRAKDAAPIAVGLAAAWALVIISVAWAIFRPLVTVGFIAATAVLIAVIIGLRAWRARI